jgi:hypothetical protein
MRTTCGQRIFRPVRRRRQTLDFIGGRDRDRTCDPLIKSKRVSLCGALHFFEKLLENKHMNDTNHDINMTGNADNCDALRTKSGQGISRDEQDPFEREAAKAAINTLERELARAKEANDGLKLRLAKVRENLSRELAEAQGNVAALKDFENYCRVSIRRTLDEVAAPYLFPDIGAPARKPMMPTERIKALAEQRDTLAEALEMSRNKLLEVLDDTEKEQVSFAGDDFHETLKVCEQALATVKGGDK